MLQFRRAKRCSVWPATVSLLFLPSIDDGFLMQGIKYEDGRQQKQRGEAKEGMEQYHNNSSPSKATRPLSLAGFVEP